MDDVLTIAGERFRSRLMLGTGRHRSVDELLAALDASQTEIVTVAIGRIDFDNPNEKNLLDYIDWSRFHVLPNTAGSRTADEAVRTARLGRAVTSSDWVKLEVIPDARYLLPDPVGTLQAAETLVSEGFKVLPYINADPELARRLQQIGTMTVMPLASPIGSGRGIPNLDSIRVIIEQATVPVVVDAGLGVPSDASLAMEAGADACLVNTAVAQAGDPALMAEAFRLGVEAGRKAFLAGRIPKREVAVASSPLEGVAR
jgi:thiazole synthase